VQAVDVSPVLLDLNGDKNFYDTIYFRLRVYRLLLVSRSSGCGAAWGEDGPLTAT
jgi:hypothetical protein